MGSGPLEGGIYSVKGRLVSEHLHLALPPSLELQGEKEEPERGAVKGRGRRSGENKPGKEPTLKVILFGSSSPLPHPKTQALGHRVW